MAERETDRRRRLNQDRQRLFGTQEQRTIAFLCECGDEECCETVLLTSSDFDTRTRSGEPVLHQLHGA